MSAGVSRCAGKRCEILERAKTRKLIIFMTICIQVTVWVDPLDGTAEFTDGTLALSSKPTHHHEYFISF